MYVVQWKHVIVDNQQTCWYNIIQLLCYSGLGIILSYTVEPVYNGHPWPWDKQKWLLHVYRLELVAVSN